MNAEREFSSHAIVLRISEVGESDLLATLFTHERGVITARAIAAKKSKKRFAGALTTAAIIEAIIKEKRGGFGIKEASFTGGAQSKSIEAFSEIAFICELLLSILPQEAEEREMFSFCEELLLRFEPGGYKPLEFMIIVSRILELAGFKPPFEKCHTCRLPFIEGNANGFFNREEMLMFCEKHAPARSLCISPQDASALAVIISRCLPESGILIGINPKNIYSILSDYILSITEKPLKSEQLLVETIF